MRLKLTIISRTSGCDGASFVTGIVRTSLANLSASLARSVLSFRSLKKNGITAAL